MSNADLPEAREMAATGLPPYNLRSEEGGDNRTGSLEQTRATGIVATGKKRNSIREGMSLRNLTRR